MKSEIVEQTIKILLNVNNFFLNNFYFDKLIKKNYILKI